MKKIFLLLLVPVCSWAQFAKGNKFISGNIGFDNQNYTYGNGNGGSLYQTYSVGPSFGYFLRENLAVGISIGYSGNYQQNKGSQPNTGGESKTGGFSSNLFARRFFPLSEKFFFALNGSLGYSRSNSTNINYFTNATTETKSYSWGLSISPMFIFLASTHWGFQGAIGNLYYSHSYNFTNENVWDDSGFSISGITLGFTYYIR